MSKQVMKPRRKAKLPQAPPMEPRHKRTLIVVADGARARFFEPRHDSHTLVPAGQADMVAPESRLQNQEIVADKPGRGFGSADASTHRHAFEPHHDPHKLEKHNFTAELARSPRRALRPIRSAGRGGAAAQPGRTGHSFDAAGEEDGEPSDPEGSDGRQSSRLVACLGKGAADARPGLARLSPVDRACGRCACAAT